MRKGSDKDLLASISRCRDLNDRGKTALAGCALPGRTDSPADAGQRILRGKIKRRVRMGGKDGMMRVDLITGFLGAGKTTFIHRYLQYLRGQKTLIIENEFGSIGVDTSFLRDEDCEIEDLSGVCMCCKGKDQFTAMLLSAAARGYDRVLVEPSGIYDVDEFFSVMDDRAVKACCEVGSILAIVDAHIPEGMSWETRLLIFRQLMAAGMVIVSKTQLQELVTPSEMVEYLNDLIFSMGGNRSLDETDVCFKAWDSLTDGDFARFQSCGSRRDEHERGRVNHEEIYETSLIAGYCQDEQDLRERMRALMSDERFGLVLRAKGYVRDFQKDWYEVNCTRGELSVRPATKIKRGVLVIVGQNLNDAELGAQLLPKPEIG